MYLIYGKWTVGKATAQFCRSKNIPYEMYDDTDAHTIGDTGRFEWVIVTPGIAPSHPFLQSCGLPVIGELQLVTPYIPSKTKIISVTGTDGKSTCCWMLFSLLRQLHGEDRVFLSGNFGTPLSHTLLEIDPEQENCIILEVSSFMAERSEWFWSDVTLWTNFETDHLNWHPTHQAYFDAKWKLVQQTKIAFLSQQLLTARDKYSLTFPETQATIQWVGDGKHIHKKGNTLCTQHRSYDFGTSNFAGEHNAQNLLMVLAALEVFFPDTDWTPYIPNVFPLEHRCEEIGMYDNRTYIDDSKSTSCQSLSAALQSFDRPIILIAGGSDKWDVFDGLEPLMQKHVRGVVAIGQTAPAFIQLAQKTGIQHSHELDMQAAVNTAVSMSHPDDIILLSPWCASFGLFRDYLDRALKFRAAVLHRPVEIQGYTVFFTHWDAEHTTHTPWSALTLYATRWDETLCLWHGDTYDAVLNLETGTGQEQELRKQRRDQVQRETHW